LRWPALLKRRDARLHETLQAACQFFTRTEFRRARWLTKNSHRADCKTFRRFWPTFLADGFGRHVPLGFQVDISGRACLDLFSPRARR
jgi:hypothetical protein